MSLFLFHPEQGQLNGGLHHATGLQGIVFAFAEINAFVKIIGRQVPKFSKYQHGVALLLPQLVRNTPHWYELTLCLHPNFGFGLV